MAEALVDTFGRTVRDLRISVTDRCNFRCTYCMPEEGMVWLPRDEILTFEEIARVARICVERFGVDSIRLTGGEPTVRARLHDLVALLAPLRVGGHPGGALVDLAMTTNAASLRQMAADLYGAGLRRINISCDSLKRERFLAISKRDALSAVLDGIDAALEVGFHPVKLNCVLMRGINDDEVVDFATFGRQRGVTVRFIEFMPLDAQGAWDKSQLVPGHEIYERIHAVWPLVAVDVGGSAPAERFTFEDGHGEIGLISSVTQPFCGTCNRLRLTADGAIRNCLFSDNEFSLRDLMRNGGDDDEVALLLRKAVWEKYPGHAINEPDFLRPSRSMSMIGG
jgi:GTP 3',8-cyclase